MEPLRAEPLEALGFLGTSRISTTPTGGVFFSPFTVFGAALAVLEAILLFFFILSILSHWRSKKGAAMSVCYSFGLFFSILFSTERPTISPLPCATMSRICPARRLRSFWMLCGFQRSRQGFCLSRTVLRLGDMFTAYRHYARKAKTGFARKQGLTPLKFFTYDGQGGGIHDIQTSA